MRLKKMLMILIITFLVLLVAMFISTPSKNNVEDWVYENYGYNCDRYGVCQKDNIEVLVIAEHYRNAGIFISLERSIELPENSVETETIRAFGIFNNIYKIEDNPFWRIVN